jgi:hypothetical protein
MMKRWLAVAALAVAACSGSSGTSDDGGADLRKGPEVCTPDGQSVALSGQYAVQANLLVTVKVPTGCSGASCIVNTDANSELLLLGTISTTGTNAMVNVRPCKIVIPPVALKGQNKPLTLDASPTLVKSVPTVMSTATLSGTQTCANFNAQPITIALGANLQNTATDSLPMFTQGGAPPIPYCGGVVTTACVPAPTQFGCVCDQEGDGKPGATLGAMNVPGFTDLDQLYVDLRTSVTLAGQVFPPAAGQTNPGQRIKGMVSGIKLDTGVLGCHHAGPPATDCSDTDTSTAGALNPNISQSANGPSTFTAVPVAAGDTCDTVIANEATLFGQ